MRTFICRCVAIPHSPSLCFHLLWCGRVWWLVWQFSCVELYLCHLSEQAVGDSHKHMYFQQNFSSEQTKICSVSVQLCLHARSISALFAAKHLHARTQRLSPLNISSALSAQPELSLEVVQPNYNEAKSLSFIESRKSPKKVCPRADKIRASTKRSERTELYLRAEHLCS